MDRLLPNAVAPVLSIRVYIGETVLRLMIASLVAGALFRLVLSL